MAKNKSKASSSSEGKTVSIVNRNARRNYEILEKLEAGISLKGNEVKSIRAGEINIKDAYVRVLNDEAFLVGAHISPYEFSRVAECDPMRDRKLLLHRKEIEWLNEQGRKKGLSAVPLKIYFTRGRCKLQVGVGRGKKLHDKREDVKKREAQRAMERAIKTS